MNVSGASVLLLLLVVVLGVAAALAADQYDERHDNAGGGGGGTRVVSSRRRAEATDREKNTSTNAVKTSSEEAAAEEEEEDTMQVGCGYGLVERVPAPKPHQRSRSNSKSRRRRDLTSFQRKRRNYQTGTFTIYQPSVYQLSRPYVIPVWGSAGRLPIYFPPQPVVLKRPSDPRTSYLPPKGYLPPDTKTKPSTTTIGYDDDDEDDGGMGMIPSLVDRVRDPDDDAPIWDFEPAAVPLPVRTTPRPVGQGNQGGPPTRRRPNHAARTQPPLVHRSENGSGINHLRPMSQGPAVIQVPQNQFRPSTTTAAPPPSPTRAQPSRCVWAIISCCTGSTPAISYDCFEQLGCVGAFWDKSPCDSDFAKAAVDIALQYYSQK